MLYITPTPIGNLADITLRALDTLKQCDFIIAENPSHSKKLLDHYGIKGKKLIQFAEHNEERMLPALITQLQSTDGCLVSDAGTPGISDPGFRLVRACREQGINVVALPGPNAAITALSASGLPTDKFIFMGFLQKTEPKILKALNEGKQTESTIIFYESPQRIMKTLETIAKIHPEAHVVVARELTKIHEEFIRGSAAEVQSQLQQKATIKGEITVLVSCK